MMVRLVRIAACIAANIMAKPKSQFSLARDFIDNEDNRTVYFKCAFWLLPWEAKPGVRLMHDWIYLLTV